MSACAKAAPEDRHEGNPMKVIIVGGGIMGLATAWALARRPRGRHCRGGGGRLDRPAAALLGSSPDSVAADRRLFRPAGRPARGLATGPMIIDKTGDVGLYLAPPAEGRGLKIGDHAFSLSLLKGFERWRIDRLKACFYTVTGDERFVVEKQGARGWVMSPCSGHGFKFGAVMGLELAHTIVASRDPAAHAPWGPVWKAISRPDRMS